MEQSTDSKGHERSHWGKRTVVKSDRGDSDTDAVGLLRNH